MRTSLSRTATSSMLSGVATWSAVVLSLAQTGAAGSVEYLGEDAVSGLSAAVVVSGCPLAHTGQLLPVGEDGQLVGEGAVDAQLAQLLFNLETVLASVDSSTDRLVKINFYVDSVKTADSARNMLAKRFPAPVRPAVSFVATRLPHPKAIIALDAVAAVPESAVARSPSRTTTGVAAVLPCGEAVYVAARSEQGDLAAATAQTMANLLQTLDRLDLRRGRMVQLRAFLQPMDQAEVVRQQIAKALGGSSVPPLTFVESTGRTPIAIELIVGATAASAAPAAAGSVHRFTLPGAANSPDSCCAVRVQGTKRIYLAGTYAERAGSGEEQVRDIWTTIGRTLQLCGGDPRRLAQATWCFSENGVGEILHRSRAEFYDPQHPPAGSDVAVRGVGRSERSVVVDMIAVAP